MGETTDQIERHIRDTRSDLSGNFSELEESIKSTVDWRLQCEKHPGAMMALACSGGVLLSALLPRFRPLRRSSKSRENTPAEDDGPGLSVNSRPAFDAQVNQRAGPLDAFKWALVGVATTKLSSLIEDLFPGFKSELSKAQTRRKSDRANSFAPGPPPSRMEIN